MMNNSAQKRNHKKVMENCEFAYGSKQVCFCHPLDDESKAIDSRN